MKNTPILVSILILFSTLAFAQVSENQPNTTYGTSQTFSGGGSAVQDLGFWVLPFSGATSPATRIPGNTWRFQRTQYLIRASEIATGGFPSGLSINGLGFFISEQGVGTQTGNLKIYMKNTTDATYSLGTSWTTTDFTLVSDNPSWTIPIAPGLFKIPFSGGSPFIYSGNGVYIAFEFSNPADTLGTTALAARCNDQLADGLRGSRNNTAMPTTLPASSFRPATMFFNDSLVDIAQVNRIYTLEKVAVGYAPTPIEVQVTNVSAAQASFDVIIEVKDSSNTITYYSASQPVSNLAAGASTFVSFPGWEPSEEGIVNIVASTSAIPTENWLSNNTLGIKANVNSNTLSYTFNNANPSSFGYNFPNTGLFLSRYSMKGSGTVQGANIVISNGTNIAGNTIYAVVCNSSGSVLGQSANYVIQPGDLGTTKSFTFPNPPTFQNQDFFVGMAQTAGTATWRPLGIFTENPQRQNTFYSATLSGTGLTQIESVFRMKFGIEAVLGQITSVSDIQTEDFSVYPNPVGDLLTIDLLSTKSSPISYFLYDTKGKLLLSGSEMLTSGRNLFSVKTEQLAPGMYFLRSSSDGLFRHTMVIKQ